MNVFVVNCSWDSREATRLQPLQHHHSQTGVTPDLTPKHKHLKLHHQHVYLETVHHVVVEPDTAAVSGSLHSLDMQVTACSYLKYRQNVKKMSY